MKRFLQKIMLCFCISGLVFIYLNTIDIDFFYSQYISMLMSLYFILVYLVNTNLSVQKVFKYGVLFQFLASILSMLFGFLFWILFQLKGISTFYYLLFTLIIVYFAFLQSKKGSFYKYINTAFNTMRHVFIFSIFTRNIYFPIWMSWIKSIIYILCIFIILQYYFFYSNSFDDMESMSDLLLIEVLTCMHFIFLNLCFCF